MIIFHWIGMERVTNGKTAVYGERSRTMFVVAKIAKTLGISVDELLF